MRVRRIGTNLDGLESEEVVIVSYAFGMHSSRRMHWSNAGERRGLHYRRTVGVGYFSQQTRNKLNH